MWISRLLAGSLSETRRSVCAMNAPFTASRSGAAPACSVKWPWLSVIVPTSPNEPDGSAWYHFILLRKNGTGNLPECRRLRPQPGVSVNNQEKKQPLTPTEHGGRHCTHPSLVRCTSVCVFSQDRRRSLGLFGARRVPLRRLLQIALRGNSVSTLHCDLCCMLEKFRVADSHCKCGIDLFVCFGELPVRVESPGVSVQGEYVMSTGELALRNLQCLRRLVRVIGIIEDEFVVGIVGAAGLLQ